MTATVVRTFRLKGRTAQRLKTLASRLGAYESPLAELLLDRALTEVETGRWHLDRRPVKFNIEWSHDDGLQNHDSE